MFGGFTCWNEQLVCGCDDSAQKEFLNKRKVKGNIEGPEQSNSNIWFTSVEQPDQLGPNTAEGAVWLNKQVNTFEPSEPFLFAIWPKRYVRIRNDGDKTVQFTFETDDMGNDSWKTKQTMIVKAGQSAQVEFSPSDPGEWIRIFTDTETKTTVHFYYAAGLIVCPENTTFTPVTPYS